MNLPHALTLFRILTGPLFLLFYAYYDLLGIPESSVPYCLVTLLAISEITDGIDGYYARRFNLVTDLGKVMDPMADSIAHISVFLTFTLEPVSLPLAFILVFFYRDSLVSMLRMICAKQGFALAARKSGKLKTVLLATVSFAILFLMILYSHQVISREELQTYSCWMTGFAAAYTTLTMFDYFYSNWSYVNSLLNPRSK